MRKTILYLVILAVLGIAVYFFLIKSNDNPYGQTEAGFTVKDTAAIGKLFIADNDGESVLVERTDSGWVVNKKYKALRSTLNMILTTLTRQAALYPVTKNAYENVIKNLSTDGKKVEVYGRDGKKITVFYVGGVAVNNTGTNMLMEGAKMPYVVQVQGFNGYLTSQYTTNMADWRDRTIFSFQPDEIKSVSIQYPDKPINSFAINRENGTFSVSADTNITKHLDPLNIRRINVYLKYFGNVNCEGYLNGFIDTHESIATAPKRATMEITGMHGQRQHADIYWMPINKRSKNLTVANEDVPDDYDADRMYAVINDGQDTVMIQQMIFKNMFRKSFEFYQKDVTPTQMPPNNEPPRNVMMHKNQ